MDYEQDQYREQIINTIVISTPGRTYNKKSRTALRQSCISGDLLPDLLFKSVYSLNYFAITRAISQTLLE